jgi:sec-independent protein translocase protein TatB
VFGINGGELIVLLVVAVVVVGPERLPRYAEQLARWTRQLRLILADAKQRLAEELGPELGDVDWATLDPRRYDPRRIVRDALTEEIQQVRLAGLGAASAVQEATDAAYGRSAAAHASDGLPREPPADGPAPFDDEAT